MSRHCIKLEILTIRVWKFPKLTTFSFTIDLYTMGNYHNSCVEIPKIDNISLCNWFVHNGKFPQFVCGNSQHWLNFILQLLCTQKEIATIRVWKFLGLTTFPLQLICTHMENSHNSCVEISNIDKNFTCNYFHGTLPTLTLKSKSNLQ